ncbi:hypothetical protein B0J13DRAFT_645805 [Dactylonectria estremocensis]|uniref:Uncharacterized protein n=1 Tax=Dactylonectria estremocensis TaxID=1079267 RepID=A0A9P9IQS3_9HYPO|nr:hypothetical protein B0J13DRAFT_645805 [Dactylonectria estremocensis]
MASKQAQVIESPFAVDLNIPVIDIPSYVFSTRNPQEKAKPVYFDARNPSVNLSLQEAEVYVKRLARGLIALGLQPGDKVLLISQNNLFVPVVLWGVIAAGCVFTAASPGASAYELCHQFRDSDSKLVLAGPSQVDVAREAIVQAGQDPKCLYVFDGALDNRSSSGPATQPPSWTSLFVAADAIQDWHWKVINTLEDARNTTAIINYSSGYVGVELSHYNQIAQVEQIIFKRARVANSDEGRARAARLAESGERWLAPLPMYHAFGQTYYAMTAPRVGAKVFVMDKFNLLEYLTYIDTYRITFINLVPTIVRMIAKVPRPERFNLKSLQIVGSGSAPLDAEVAQVMNDKFLQAGICVKQGWGMTETTCNVTGFSPDDFDDGRSIGWVNPTCRLRIVPVPNRDFSRLEREQDTTVGEIWVSGPNVMKGYWKRPDETASAVLEVDGHRWVRTGDIGYADKRGCVYIVDRIKELIKVKGLQVSPAEIEQTLLSHPGVLEAAVVGADIGDRECPRAFVVRKNLDVTAESLNDLVKSKLAQHKWLTGGIYFLDKLPRTGIGKVRKRALPDPTQRQVKI